MVSLHTSKPALRTSAATITPITPSTGKDVNTPMTMLSATAEVASTSERESLAAASRAEASIFFPTWV